jgi:hypothetical protein
MFNPTQHGKIFWGLLLCLFLLNCCGYSFPHVYEGPRQVVYMPTWQNRTNKLGLDMKMYQSLARWFQKSEKISLTKDKSKADLVLAGEILSIELPSISWNTISDATGTKVNLHIRYMLKDNKSGKLLWEVPDKLYTADYSIPTATIVADNEALSKIIDDMSEEIYLGVLNKIRKAQKQATTPSATH